MTSSRYRDAALHHQQQDQFIDHKAQAADILDSLSDKTFPRLTRARRGVAVSVLSDAMHDVKLVKQLAFQGVVPRVMSLLENHSSKLEPTRLGELGNALLKLSAWESDVVRAKVLIESELPQLSITQLEHAVQNLSHFEIEDADDRRACEWADLITVWQALLRSLLRSSITIDRLRETDLPRILGILIHVHTAVTERYFLRRDEQDDSFVKTLALTLQDNTFRTIIQGVPQASNAMPSVGGPKQETSALDLVSHILARSKLISISLSATQILEACVLPLRNLDSPNSYNLGNESLVMAIQSVQEHMITFLAPGLRYTLVEPELASNEENGNDVETDSNEEEKISLDAKSPLSDYNNDVDDELDAGSGVHVPSPKHDDEIQEWAMVFQSSLKIWMWGTNHRAVLVNLWMQERLKPQDGNSSQERISLDEIWHTLSLIDYMESYWQWPRSVIKIKVKLLQALKRVYSHVQQQSNVIIETAMTSTQNKKNMTIRSATKANTRLTKNIGMAAAIQNSKFDKYINEIINLLQDFSQLAEAESRPEEEYDNNKIFPNTNSNHPETISAFFQNAILCVAQTFEPLFELNALVADKPWSITTQTGELAISTLRDLLLIVPTWLRDPCQALLQLIVRICQTMPALKDPHFSRETVSLCFQLTALLPEHPKLLCVLQCCTSLLVTESQLRPQLIGLLVREKLHTIFVPTDTQTSAVGACFARMHEAVRNPHDSITPGDHLTFMWVLDLVRLLRMMCTQPGPGVLGALVQLEPCLFAAIYQAALNAHVVESNMPRMFLGFCSDGGQTLSFLLVQDQEKEEEENEFDFDTMMGTLGDEAAEEMKDGVTKVDIPGTSSHTRESIMRNYGSLSTLLTRIENGLLEAVVSLLEQESTFKQASKTFLTANLNKTSSSSFFRSTVPEILLSRLMKSESIDRNYHVTVQLLMAAAEFEYKLVLNHLTYVDKNDRMVVPLVEPIIRILDHLVKLLRAKCVLENPQEYNHKKVNKRNEILKDGGESIHSSSILPDTDEERHTKLNAIQAALLSVQESTSHLLFVFYYVLGHGYYADQLEAKLGKLFVSALLRGIDALLHFSNDTKPRLAPGLSFAQGKNASQKSLQNEDLSRELTRSEVGQPTSKWIHGKLLSLFSSTIWRFALLCGRFRSAIRNNSKFHELIALADVAISHLSPQPSRGNAIPSKRLQGNDNNDDELALTTVLGVTETWRALIRSYGAEMAGNEDGHGPGHAEQVLIIGSLTKVLHNGLTDRDVVHVLTDLVDVCNTCPGRQDVLTSVLCVCQELAMFGPATVRNRLTNIVPLVLGVLHNNIQASAQVSQCIMEFIVLVPRINLLHLVNARQNIFRGKVAPGLMSFQTLAQIQDDELTRIERVQGYLPLHLAKAKQCVVRRTLSTLMGQQQQQQQQKQEEEESKVGDGEYGVGGTRDWTERTFLQLRVEQLWEKEVGSKLQLGSIPLKALDEVVRTNVQQRRDRWRNLKAIAVHGELKKQDMTDSRIRALESAGIQTESLACALSSVSVENASATRSYIHTDPYLTTIRTRGIADDIEKRDHYDSLSRLALAGRGIVYQ